MVPFTFYRDSRYGMNKTITKYTHTTLSLIFFPFASLPFHFFSFPSFPSLSFRFIFFYSFFLFCTPQHVTRPERTRQLDISPLVRTVAAILRMATVYVRVIAVTEVTVMRKTLRT